MTSDADSLREQLQVDVRELHREEVFSDLRVATIRKLTPVKADGTDDPSRPVVFIASTQILSQMGPLPVSAEIEAKDLADAVAKFPDAIRGALDRMMEEARELQRREASRLVVPGPGALPPSGKGPISLR